MHDVTIHISNVFDIFGVSESWLNDHSDSEVSVPGYDIIRNDGSIQRRCDVIIYYRNSPTVLRRLDLGREDIEGSD